VSETNNIINIHNRKSFDFSFPLQYINAGKNANTIDMKEIETIEKTNAELSELEKEILDEHTERTARQLSHYIKLKRKKLYLKKKLNDKRVESIKTELKNSIK